MNKRHAFDFYATPSGGIVNGQSFGMPYPEVIKRRSWLDVNTIDIREDSHAEAKVNFLSCQFQYSPDLIITNPPFSIAVEIAKKSLEVVNQDTGKVCLLQRIGWLGSGCRDEFFSKHPPSVIVFHARRPSFGGVLSTDSVEYAHFVWDKADKSGETRVIRIRSDYSKR